jgi:hypothetical protein
VEDAMTNKNTMPRYLVLRQFKADSARAADYADQTGDSSRWIQYQTLSFRRLMLDTSDDSRSPLLANLRKPSPYKSALAERMARIRAQAAAQQPAADSGQPAPANDTVVRRRTPRAPRKDSSAPSDALPVSPDHPIRKDSIQR